ncbi:hypothetical protein SHIRM173S_02061 [Streptomyces hirsutus]
MVVCSPVSRLLTRAVTPSSSWSNDISSGREAQIAAEFAGMGQQHRLEVVLAALAPPAGAEPGQAAPGVDLLEQPLAVAVRQTRRLHDAVVVRQDRRDLLDLLFHSGHPEQLHGAHVVAAPARVDRRARVTFDERVRHAQTPQEHGHRQAHEGAAHDEDGRAVAGLAGLLRSVH